MEAVGTHKRAEGAVKAAPSKGGAEVATRGKGSASSGGALKKGRCLQKGCLQKAVPKKVKGRCGALPSNGGGGALKRSKGGCLQKGGGARGAFYDRAERVPSGRHQPLVDLRCGSQGRVKGGSRHEDEASR